MARLRRQRGAARGPGPLPRPGSFLPGARKAAAGDPRDGPVVVAPGAGSGPGRVCGRVAVRPRSRFSSRSRSGSPSPARRGPVAAPVDVAAPVAWQSSRGPVPIAVPCAPQSGCGLWLPSQSRSDCDPVAASAPIAVGLPATVRSRPLPSQSRSRGGPVTARCRRRPDRVAGRSWLRLRRRVRGRKRRRWRAERLPGRERMLEEVGGVDLDADRQGCLLGAAHCRGLVQCVGELGRLAAGDA